MAPPTKRITLFIGVVGIWLMAFPFTLGAPPADTWNDIVVGGMIVTLAGYNYSHEQGQGSPDQRVSGLTVLLGSWLLFAPFVNGTEGFLLWNDVAAGVLVASFGGYNTYAAPITNQPINHETADGN